MTGYDSRKGQTTAYDLPLDLPGCDCPDATWRPEREGGCKHADGLQKLLELFSPAANEAGARTAAS